MESVLIKEKIVLESNLESINKVTSYVDEIISSVGGKLNSAYGNIIISLTEAVNNAINHGNKNNPEKKIIVCYKKTKLAALFSVEDEGDGFDYTNIPDPTAPENLGKLNWRGVFLMKNLADAITFLDNGRKIELTFNFE